LSIADRNKELQQQLDQAQAEGAELRQELAEATAAQQRAEKTAAAAQRKVCFVVWSEVWLCLMFLAVCCFRGRDNDVITRDNSPQTPFHPHQPRRQAQAALRNLQLLQQQQKHSQKHSQGEQQRSPAMSLQPSGTGSRGGAAAARQQTPPPPPSLRTKRGAAGAGSSSSGATDGAALRGEVDHLRLQVGRLQEALKQSDRRAAEQELRLVRHAAQMQRLQGGGLGSSAGTGRPGTPDYSQVQGLVAAVLQQVVPLINHPELLAQFQQQQQQQQQFGSQLPIQQRHHQQQQQPQRHPLPWAVSSLHCNAGSSRAASAEPEFSGAAATPSLATRHHLSGGGPGRQQHTHLPGSSLGRVSSAAATTLALPVQTPTGCAHAIGRGFSACSLSSVMHSGVTLQDPGSPGPLLETGTSAERGQTSGEAARQLRWRLRERGGRGAPVMVGDDEILGCCNFLRSDDGEDDDGEDDGGGDGDLGMGSSGDEGACEDDDGGDICSSVAAGSTHAAKRSAGRWDAGAEAQGGKRSRRQDAQPSPQQQAQAVKHRLGRHLSQLRLLNQQQSEAEQVARAADALVTEAAVGASAAALGEAFRAVALSGVAHTWDSARLIASQQQQHGAAAATPEATCGLVAWAADPAAEAVTLQRLAACAQLLHERLPAAAGREFVASLIAHLRAVLGLPAHGCSSGGSSSRAADAADALPFACASAAVLAYTLRKLERLSDMRALLWDLLAVRTQQQALQTSAMPQLLAAVAAWPQALKQQQQAHCCTWFEFAMQDPQLALLHATLQDACAEAVGLQQQDRDAASVLLSAAPAWWGAGWAEQGFDSSSGGSAAVAQVVSALEQRLLAQLQGVSGGQVGGAGGDGEFAQAVCAALQQGMKVLPEASVLGGAVARLQEAAETCLTIGVGCGGGDAAVARATALAVSAVSAGGDQESF